MTFFVKKGNSYTVTDSNDLDIHTTLPAANYTIKATPDGVLYFEQIDSFVPIKKVYGDAIKHADRIMSTFKDRSVSTGVLLAGEKGSGKTLLAKTLSLNAAELGMPTIIISAPWHGESFNKLIQDVDQPAVVLFDEFEKVYDRDQQQHMLTLLDGVYPTKKLFILTCNDTYRIDQHLSNRPGRIFYSLAFKGLDVQFITEYCNENLANKEHIDTICKTSMMFGEFNFDMLKALVEDMNRYNESPQEVMKMLNAKPTADTGGTYEVVLTIDGVITAVDEQTISFNPLSQPNITVVTTETNDYLQFNTSHIKNIDVYKGEYVYVNGNAKVTFTRQKLAQFDYFKSF